ncbi:MAG: fatty acid desaturase [Myxococcota bacterium]
MIAATLEKFTVLPNVQFRKNPRFYIHYDAVYLIGCLALLALMRVTDFRGLTAEWRPEYWLLLPFVSYAQILCSVFIHVCTHKSFPRWCNRLIGELCGIAVLTRFASWEIVHQRHHQFSDDPEKDPHPVDPSYWRYLFKTIVNVEKQLQQAYFETYGDTPENRRFERRRAWFSYVTNILLILTWYTFLGPSGFFFLFVPAALIGVLHLVHFNWTTHNANQVQGTEYRPINQDSGIYWLGNRLFFGIYMHKNHHDRPQVLNPLFMPVKGR